MTYSIITEGLVKRFGDTVALDGIDLAVRTGSVFGLLGPNGAGKTTAVRILATLLRPDGGHAAVCGHDVVTHAHQVRQLTGLTGQYASVDETLTGRENLILIGRLTGQSRADPGPGPGTCWPRSGLTTPATGRPRPTPAACAGGWTWPPAWSPGRGCCYLDEPTTGLDPRSRNEMWDVVRGLTATGVTVLLTTQYLEEADQLASEIAVVDHGAVIATGTPEELKARTGALTLAVRPAERGGRARGGGRRGPVSPHAEPEIRNTTVTAPVSDERLMPAVVRRLDDDGIRVAELTLRGSSLDEVFLSLTGRRAEETSTEQSSTVNRKGAWRHEHGKHGDGDQGSG